MTAPRNSILQNLFELGAAATWTPTREGDGQWLYAKRKWRDFSQVDKPAFMQIGFRESIKQITNQPYKNTFFVHWLAYWTVDPQNDEDLGDVTMNSIADALQAALAPSVSSSIPRQTLGGLVYHAYLDGEVIKVSGDESGEGFLLMPITILAP